MLIILLLLLFVMIRTTSKIFISNSLANINYSPLPGVCERGKVNLQLLGRQLGLTWKLVSDTVELDLKAVIRRLKR